MSINIYSVSIFNVVFDCTEWRQLLGAICFPPFLYFLSRTETSSQLAESLAASILIVDQSIQSVICWFQPLKCADCIGNRLAIFVIFNESIMKITVWLQPNSCLSLSPSFSSLNLHPSLLAESFLYRTL